MPYFGPILKVALLSLLMHLAIRGVLSGKLRKQVVCFVALMGKHYSNSIRIQMEVKFTIRTPFT